MTTTPDTQAATLQAIVMERFQQEKDRKTLLETRGTAIIAITGTLITATVGIVGLLKTQAGFATIPNATEIAVLVGFGLFVLAMLAGISSNWLLPYGIFDDERDVIPAITKHWNDEAGTMPQEVWLRRANNVSQAAKENDLKARAVMIGLALQVLAFISLAVGAGILVAAPASVSK